MWSFLKQYAWIADILGVLLCAYFLANIVGMYLEGKLEVSKSLGMFVPQETEITPRISIPRSAYNIIVERNIFDSTAVAPTEDMSTSSAEKKRRVNLSGEAVKTSLGIKVIGVLVVGNGRDSRSTATIVASSGSSDVYAVGDENRIAPETKLIKVAPDRIEFINRDQLEYAEVTVDFGQSIFQRPFDSTVVASREPSPSGNEDSGVKSESPGKFMIDQKEVDEALNNMDRLYTDIRAVPNFSGGKIAGMKILSVKSDSIFSKLGLKRGDILLKINGMDLDVRQGFQIFNQLKDQKSFTVDLTRRGSPITLEYEIR